MPPALPDPTHCSDVGRWLSNAIFMRSGLHVVVDPRLDPSVRCRLEQHDSILRVPEGMNFGDYQSATVRTMMASLWGPEIYRPGELIDLDLTGKPWEPE